MFQAILSKEFLKIRNIYIGLILFLLASMVYLYIDIVTNFSAIEPHSMLWYEAIFIGNIYYDILKFLPSIAAVVIALAQFLPEIHKKKFRIPLHLPVNQNKMVFLYLIVGLFLLTFINILFITCLYFVSLTFYHNLISISAITNTIPWILSSYIIYNGTASLMIEPYWKRKAYIAITFLFLVSMLFFNPEYEAYNQVLGFYALILVLSFFIPLLSLYRFKNGNTALGEHHTIIPKIALFIMILFSFITLGFYTPYIFKKVSKDNSLSTFVFYSSKENKFVYKKEFGNHNFSYGDSLNNSLSKEAFEESLPFVYWRNLDIQKRLPIDINGVSYDKTKIKKARQSFKLDYKDLQENKIQTQLYPLFNPNSKKGMIAFPEHMFNLDKDFSIYDSETNKKDEVLSNKYNKIFNQNSFLFPAKIVAGKTTNIKPLDEGYFVLDSKDDLFHIKVYDDQMNMSKINYDKNIKIQNLKISESRKKEFYGTLLDEQGEIYIISYKNYELIKLALKDYNAQTMKLEIYANPVNKLVRYQDNEYVYAYAFDKDFNYLSDYKIDIPKDSIYYNEVFEYLFPFYISSNDFKEYESYSLKINSYKAFIFSSIFAIIFFLIYRKKEFVPTLIKSLLILFGGIYTLCFIAFI